MSSGCQICQSEFSRMDTDGRKTRPRFERAVLDVTPTRSRFHSRCPVGPKSHRVASSLSMSMEWSFDVGQVDELLIALAAIDE
jgi:hypothetical protein